MSKKDLVLLAARYPDQNHAETILSTLEKMHAALTIDLKDAVMITKEPDGRIRTHETTDVTGTRGALRGVIAGGIFGFLFPPSLLVSALVGGGIGAAWGKLRDTGVRHDEIREFTEELTSGQAALIVLVSSKTAKVTQETLGFAEGDVLTKAYGETDFVRSFESASQP